MILNWILVNYCTGRLRRWVTRLPTNSVLACAALLMQRGR